MTRKRGTAGYLVPFQLILRWINVSDGTQQPESGKRREKSSARVTFGMEFRRPAVPQVMGAQKAFEVSDERRVLVQPAITVHKQAAWVPISVSRLCKMRLKCRRAVVGLLQTARDDLKALLRSVVRHRQQSALRCC